MTANTGNIGLKNVERQEISAHIKEFIARGGKIEQLSNTVTTVKPVGSAWNSDRPEIPLIN